MVECLALAARSKFIKRKFMKRKFLGLAILFVLVGFIFNIKAQTCSSVENVSVRPKFYHHTKNAFEVTVDNFNKNNVYVSCEFYGISKCTQEEVFVGQLVNEMIPAKFRAHSVPQKINITYEKIKDKFSTLRVKNLVVSVCTDDKDYDCCQTKQE